MASSANAYSSDPLGAAATEPSAQAPGTADSPVQTDYQTRIDAAALVVEVPVRAYSAYEPGVIVANKFQLVRILGEGGMGSVWVAKNLALDVHVALKLIRTELARSVPGLEERLLQEARAAASIEHPAVIKIFDFGLTELRDPFIAMELLHGESLAGTIKRRGKVNPLRAVQTLLPITEALLAAHARGIVHRDLKPDNIFLARGAGDRLVPKVLDFGIAKFQQSAAHNLTDAGTVLGSPAYMSPEQARGETDVDGRTDVWALCVVLYEVITGRLPFVGNNYNALLYGILEGQPKTFGELGINEPLLWSILLQGLEKDRNRRYPTMLELGRALATWLLDRGVHEDVCNSALKSKWLDRPALQTAAARNSFFPSEPPSADGQPRTLRSEHESAAPVGVNAEQSSGVLRRSAAETGVNVFGVPYSRDTTRKLQPTPAASGVAAFVRRSAGARWVWLSVLGAVLSFSVTVALQAVSGSGTHDDDDPPPAPATPEDRRRSRNAETTVESIVEMRRPALPSQPVTAPVSASPVARPAPAQPRPVESRLGEGRAIATVKPAHPWEPKPARSDLKNPFR